MERNIQMVDLKAQYAGIREEVQEGLMEVLESCAFINGPAVQDFKRDLGEYLDVSHVIPCANGTDALQLALMALDLEPGDEVIVPSFTYVATTEVIALLGLRPKFVEVDERTFNIDVNKIEDVITDRTRAIMPVHLFGQSADMEPLMGIADKHDLYVIEDNAQAIGAEYVYPDGKRQKTGTIGHIGCTSFYPSKNLGAYGDAGAIMTNDDELGQKISMMANHGQSKRYYHDLIGVNSRLDSFQAVVLNAKLKRLDEYNKRRQQAAGTYDQLLNAVDTLVLPLRAPYSTHVFHQYTLLAEDRDGLAEFLSNEGIPHMIYYPVPVHKQKAYSLWYTNEDLTTTERIADRVISLPMHSELKEDDQIYITEKIKSFYQ
ncbi:MAG: DegT/DnrJ/EryC1/StrS family aminotransferase [Saprospiraceae bacterium]|nr:DegT/DnrJ/EryC1/StrS family aminotransferase [Saprospiraceae bacterium]